MSSNQDDGGDGGEQADEQTSGEGSGQPEGGAPQQPPQGQPAGGGQAPPAAGHQPVARGPSASQKIQAAFGEYPIQNQIKAVIGIWAIIGLCFGLTPILLGTLGPGGALIGSIGVGLAFATGPIVAALLGLSLSNKQPVDVLPGAVVSGVINYAGFLVMVIVAAILLMAQSGGGGGVGGGGNLGDLIAPLIVAGIPVALAGGLATALGRKVDYPATREEAAAQEPPAPVAPPQQPPQHQQP